jgi:hypothetical protein
VLETAGLGSVHLADELSMCEIAMRCRRLKHDHRGRESGETSWLARRIGVLPESGASAPTPWVHTDVLGFIGRDGLGVAPSEVEVPPHRAMIRTATTIMRVNLRLDGLPGADLVEEGLADLEAGRHTEPALLVEIAAPRLRPLGLAIPHAAGEEGISPEHRLYSLLSSQPGGGAHSRYNALLSRIASFAAAAAEHATTR